MKKFTLTALTIGSLALSLSGEETSASSILEHYKAVPFEFSLNGNLKSFVLSESELCVKDHSGRYTVQPSPTNSADQVISLASDPSAERFLVFYPEGATQDVSRRLILRNDFLVKLKPETDLQAFKKRWNIQSTDSVKFLESYFACRVASAGDALKTLSEIGEDDVVEVVEPLFARSLRRRWIPSDDLASPNMFRSEAGFDTETSPLERVLVGYQWYLNNVGENGGTVGVDIGLAPVPDSVIGTGVRIAIVDDGLGLTHGDLQPNIAPLEPGNHLNLNGQTVGNRIGADPRDPEVIRTIEDVRNSPLSLQVEEGADPNRPFTNDDTHGTMVAGVIGGVRNGPEVEVGDDDNGAAITTSGISGVAPGSTLHGIRILSNPVTDFEEAQALTFQNDRIQIYNNSWGTNDDDRRLSGPGRAAAAALRNGALLGRPSDNGPLGSIFVWAAGNGAAVEDDSNYDGYANSIYTIAVAGVNDQGRKNSVSEPGANIVVSGPSDRVGGQGITTTTFGVARNIDGFDDLLPRYTNRFGDTSSAAAAVSGVVALMLQEEPNLNWRQVQDILIRTANSSIDPSDPDWIENGDGIRFNHQYGAGLVNADAAVEMADDYLDSDDALQPLEEQPQFEFQRFQREAINPGDQTREIPDNTGAPKLVFFDFEDRPNLKVEHVQVTMTVVTERRNDLDITLISPSGTQSRLQESSTRDVDDQSIVDWTFSTVRNWGEPSSGAWVLAINDRRTGAPALITDATLIVNGAPDPDNEFTQTPVLVSAPTLSVDQGEEFSYRVIAAGADSITVGNLPEGLTYNPETRQLSGILPQPGLVTIPILLAGDPSVTVGLRIIVRPTSIALGGAVGIPGFPAIALGDRPWDFELTETNDPEEIPLDFRRAATSALGLRNSGNSILGFNDLPQGVMLFDWRVSSREGLDRLWFSFGEEVPDSWEAFISGETDWKRVAIPLNESSNNVRFIYQKDAEGRIIRARRLQDAQDDAPDGEMVGIEAIPPVPDLSGQDRGLLDNVEFITFEKFREDVIDAANIVNFDFQQDSRTFWLPFTTLGSPNSEGQRGSLISPGIGNGQTVSMSGSVVGPGVFNVTVGTSTAETDVFELLIDGVVLYTQMGNLGNQRNSFPIAPGRHVIELRYRKDRLESSERDFVLLDDISFVPDGSFLSFLQTAGLPLNLAPSDDNDGDDIDNFLEYAFGGDLMDGLTPDGMPTVVNTENGMVLEFVQRNDDGGLVYVVEQSDNLADWEVVGSGAPVSASGPLTTYQVPVDGTGQFYRVKVSKD